MALNISQIPFLTIPLVGNMLPFHKQMQGVALNISQIPFLTIPLVGNMLPFHTRFFLVYQNVTFSVKDGTGSKSDADTQKTCSIYCIYVKTTFYFL